MKKAEQGAAIRSQHRLARRLSHWPLNSLNLLLVLPPASRTSSASTTSRVDTIHLPSKTAPLSAQPVVADLNRRLASERSCRVGIRNGSGRGGKACPRGQGGLRRC